MVKYVFALIAAGLLIAFLGSILYKLQQISVAAVMGVGVAMMLYDLWQSLHERD
jgi:hypothetical protein